MTDSLYWKPVRSGQHKVDTNITDALITYKKLRNFKQYLRDKPIAIIQQDQCLTFDCMVSSLIENLLKWQSADPHCIFADLHSVLGQVSINQEANKIFIEIFSEMERKLTF